MQNQEGREGEIVPILLTRSVNRNWPRQSSPDQHYSSKLAMEISVNRYVLKNLHVLNNHTEKISCGGKWGELSLNNNKKKHEEKKYEKTLGGKSIKIFSCKKTPT